MKTIFSLFDEKTDSETARLILAKTKQEFKKIPNLEKTMALALTLLDTYSICWSLFKKTFLSAINQQIVYQTANFKNECDYCVPWHTLLSKKVKMPPEDTQALKTGTKLSNNIYEELRHFTRTLIHSQGNIAQANLNPFLATGYTPQQALEGVLGIAIKTMIIIRILLQVHL